MEQDKSTSESMLELLFETVPTSLDQIIRFNRDLLEVRHANECEIYEFDQPIHFEQANVRNTSRLKDWHLIVLLQPGRQTQILLLGNHPNGKSARCLKHVCKIDLSRRLVLSEFGDICHLDEQGVGEPDVLQITLLCAVINDSGLGNFGIPSYFD